MSTTPLSRVRADLLLLHAPAVFDFRERRDIYFPYLSTSGDVPITPLYEYFPVGFKTLRGHLGEAGHEVRILNLATLLLRYPEVELGQLLSALDTELIGIDLHWMVHVQGALAVAEEIKRLRPEIQVIFGGISSTYYADELIRYPFVDMVMRGYETHEPMRLLLESRKLGQEPRNVPNLLWKDTRGEVCDNGFVYTPDSYSCGIDWSQMPESPDRRGLPVKELLSTQNAGCSYNCPWCGGSREAFRRIMGRRKAMARKPLEEVEREFASMRELNDLNRHHFYTVGTYNEPPSRLKHFIAQVARTPPASISYEQYHLTPEPVLRQMAAACPRTSITLSPESHDPEIARRAGRGVYSNREMEKWIGKALDLGIHQVDIWYFIGMPGQDEASVEGTLRYCEHLLKKFQGQNVYPFLCPMIPFLDPASTLFEQPEKHGYTVYHRSVEEHRRGMESASIVNRINYGTRWLDREDLVRVGFGAVRRLTEMKVAAGQYSASMGRRVTGRIDDALRFQPLVHEADCLKNPRERARALDALGDEILLRNREIFFGGVANQAFPLAREVGGRWFDELLWPLEELDALRKASRVG